MRSLVLDLRWAVKLLLRNPGPAAFAILSLALGVGATAAVYGTVDWLLNRPPAGIAAPDRLVAVRMIDPKRPDQGLAMGQPHYRALRAAQDVFADIGAFAKTISVVSDEHRADQVTLEFVSGNHFAMLGVRPFLGRLIQPEDAADGAAPVAVLGYDFWRSRFGGDTGIVESTILVNARRCRVIGIAPRGVEAYNLDWNGQTSLWVPMQTTQPYAAVLPPGAGSPTLMVMGRLRPEIDLELARQKAQAWIAHLPKPASGTTPALTLTSGPEMRIGRRDQARTFFGILLAVCAFVLLAACSNAANFVLGRAMSRRGELALRAALGASRGRLFRLLLTESALMAIVAAVIGVFVAIAFGQLLSTWPRAYLNLPLTSRSFSTAAAVDVRMLITAMALGIATVFAFGLVPAVIAAYRNPNEDLKNPKPKWTWSGLRMTTRQLLLMLQVGFAVALAVVAGLFLRSLARITAVDSGHVRPESVLLARVVPTGITAEEGHVFYEQLLAKLEATPGVTSATIGWNLPFMIGQSVVFWPGREEEPIPTPTTAVAAKYFETQGVPMLAGREFTSTERDLSSGVIVNRVLARRLSPDGNVVGQPLLVGPKRETVPIIGVVDSRCFYLLGDPGPCVWRAFPKGTTTGYVRVRVAQHPMAFVPTLRQIVRELNPHAAVAEEIALDAFFRESIARERAVALASSGLALFGVVLLASGCVSLFLSMVRDSAREIAIRMAIGASAFRLTLRILVQGLVVTTIGVLLGVLAARAVAPRLADELYSTEPLDPLTFVAVPAIVALIALVSVGYAASVATTTDPTKSLRID